MKLMLMRNEVIGGRRERLQLGTNGPGKVEGSTPVSRRSSNSLCE